MRHSVIVLLLAGLTVAAIAADPVAPPVAGAATVRLTLEQAEKLFSEHNRELQLAQRAVESSDALITSANALPNPALSFGTSQISPSQGVGPGSLWDKRVDTVIGVSQLFERGNKRELRAGVARANATASRSDRSEVERQQRYILQASYYDLMLAQEKLTISTETAASYGKTVDAMQLRLNAGDIAATEVARVNVDALRAQNDARLARAELSRAQLTLAYLIGSERESAGLYATGPWPSTDTPQNAADIEKIIDARADVRAAQARVDAAERGRELARSLRTRDITAGIQYERFPGDTANNSYGFFVSVPLFTNYYYEGEARKAEADWGAARDSLERTRALALAEISRARSVLDAAAERARRAREAALAAAEKAATGAEFAYSRGAIGVMDLLDARRQLYATRLEAVTAQSDYAKAFAAWRASITEQSSQ